MEAVLVAGLMASLLPKLGEVLKKKLHKKVKSDVESLSEPMKILEGSLRKAVELPQYQLGEELKLVNDLRELSYDICDIENSVDNFLAGFKGSELIENGSVIKQRIEGMTTRFAQIKSIKKQDEDVATKGHHSDGDSAYQATSTALGCTEFFRENEARELTTILIGEATKKLKIVSVVGFRGLGKTTLAKVVYDRLQSNFDYSAFFPLGPNPDMKKLFRAMINRFDHLKKNIDFLDERELISILRNLLQDKRYLVVIDDIWNIESWQTVRSALLDSSCGSRIIITTRLTYVGTKADTVYKLKTLSPEDSQKLFRSRLFGGTFHSHHLDEMSNKILEKCGGIPLAIISIASLLETKPREDWYNVYNSISFPHGDDKYVEDREGILLFKQSSLPMSLKTCLLYLATSVKKHRIERGSFVRKWIAEGFVWEDGRYSREEVANRYFHELVNMSMILPVGYDDCLGEVTYEVQYELFDELRVKSEQDNFVTFLPKDGISNTSVMAPVRLFIQFADSEMYTGTQKIDLSRVRSVTMFGPAPANMVSFKHLHYLRVLDLDGYVILDNSAMDYICRMIHLKYLSLKQTQVSELPSHIQKLVYLETLDVRKTRVKELPHEVVLLPRLVHLLFGQTSSPGGVKLPDGSNQLKSVKVLGVVDSRECSASVMEEISELKQVREIALVLHDGPADKELNDKLLSSIGQCGNLRLLEIYGHSTITSENLPASPHLPLLEELKVVGTFVKVPRWIAQVRAIEKLQMRVCKLEPNDLIILGGLPGLKTLALALVGIPTARVAITSGSGFQWLEVFTFDCAVPFIIFENGAMPRLKHLQFKLYVYPADKSPAGLMFLKSLNKVTLRYSSRHASAEGVTNTVTVIREEAARHGNLIELSINGDHQNYFLSKSIDMVDTRITATQVEKRPLQEKEVETRVSKLQITESEIEEE